MSLATLVGMRPKKTCLRASATTACCACERWPNEKVWDDADDCNLVCSWDTRDTKAPSYRIEAHEREILSVALSPASEHLLITGSADKVCLGCGH